MINKKVLCVVIDKVTKSEIHSFEFSIDVNQARVGSGGGIVDALFYAAELFERTQKYQKSLRTHKNWYVDCCFID